MRTSSLFAAVLSLILGTQTFAPASPPPSPGADPDMITLEKGMTSPKEFTLPVGGLLKAYSPPEDIQVSDGGVSVDGVPVAGTTTLFADEVYTVKAVSATFLVPKASSLGKGSVVPANLMPEPVVKIGKKGFKPSATPDAQSVGTGFEAINARLDQMDKRLDGLVKDVENLKKKASVAGPAGPQGPEGPQGPKGDTGEQGPAGPQGSTGYYYPATSQTNCVPVYRRR